MQSAASVTTSDFAPPWAKPPAWSVPGPEVRIVRRCVRHVGVELEVGPDKTPPVPGRHYVEQAETGLRCPRKHRDGDRVDVWEVWDRVEGTRLWLADAYQGAHTSAEFPPDESARTMRRHAVPFKARR